MNIELIKCEICGHMVATDALCCPRCNSRSYKMKWETHKNKAELEHLHKYKQHICNEVQDELRSHGKLYRGGLNHYLCNSMDRVMPNTNTLSFGRSECRTVSDRFYMFLIDDTIIEENRGDSEFPKNNYTILPYGKHKLGLAVIQNGHGPYSRQVHDHNTMRLHVKYTTDLFVEHNANNLVRACATIRTEHIKPFFFSSCEYRDTFEGFTVQEDPFDLYTVSLDDFEFICNLLGKKIDLHDLVGADRWQKLTDMRRLGEL